MSELDNEPVQSVSGFIEKEKNRVEFKERIKKGRKTKMFSEPFWPQIEEMLFSDVPVNDIVEFLSHQKGYENQRRESLRVLVFRIKKKVGVRHRMKKEKEYIDLHMATFGEQAIEPEIALQTLGFIALDRVLMEFGKEKDLQKTSPANNNNIKAVRDVFDTIAKIQIERKKANIPTVNLTNVQNNLFQSVDKVKEKFIERYGPRVANVMVEPESRRKILEALDQVRNIASGPISKRLTGDEVTS